ncbi:hypothetical protein ACHAXA_009729, partial [Cyclostephanos tholiformis]
MDPASPMSWPKTEVDWWTTGPCTISSSRGSYSTAIPSWRDGIERHPRPMTMYGDFGSVFDASFGSGSAWGKSALRSPLLLGICGSRTYDLIWRIKNGEFPTLRLSGMKEAAADGGGGDEDVERGRVDGDEEGAAGRGDVAVVGEEGEDIDEVVDEGVEGDVDEDIDEEEEGEKKEEEEETKEKEEENGR